MTPSTRPFGAISTVSTSSTPINDQRVLAAVDRERLKAASTTSVPTSVAVRSLRPPTATQISGSAAAVMPMLDGVMYCPQAV